MIYDCFTFFNELDILEIRLNVLKDVVDKFILVEATKTFQGKDKPLFYSENQRRFERFSNKIIHIVSNIPTWIKPDADQHLYAIEAYQRDAIMHGLKDCSQDDIVLLSDIDEIPNPEKILAYCETPGIKVFQQKLMYYFLNMQCWSEPTWQGTRMGTYADLLNPAYDLPSHSNHLFVGFKKGSPAYFRYCKGLRIKDGGWHFSYCGGAEAIIKKMKAISDTQAACFIDIVANADTASVRQIVNRGQDIYGRHEYFYVIVRLKELPEYVQRNVDKYRSLIVSQSPEEYCVAKVYFFVNAIHCYSIKLLRLPAKLLRSLLRRVRRLMGCR